MMFVIELPRVAELAFHITPAKKEHPQWVLLQSKRTHPAQLLQLQH